MAHIQRQIKREDHNTCLQQICHSLQLLLPIYNKSRTPDSTHKLEQNQIRIEPNISMPAFNHVISPWSFFSCVIARWNKKEAAAGQNTMNDGMLIIWWLPGVYRLSHIQFHGIFCTGSCLNIYNWSRRFEQFHSFHYFSRQRGERH